MKRYGGLTKKAKLVVVIPFLVGFSFYAYQCKEKVQKFIWASFAIYVYLYCALHYNGYVYEKIRFVIL